MQQHVDAVYTAAEERNLAAVSRMYQCWNSGDQGFIDEFISPNVVNHALPPGSPPGRDSFVWLYEVYRTPSRTHRTNRKSSWRMATKSSAACATAADTWASSLAS